MSDSNTSLVTADTKKQASMKDFMAPVAQGYQHTLEVEVVPVKKEPGVASNGDLGTLDSSDDEPAAAKDSGEDVA